MSSATSVLDTAQLPCKVIVGMMADRMEVLRLLERFLLRLATGRASVKL